MQQREYNRETAGEACWSCVPTSAAHDCFFLRKFSAHQSSVKQNIWDTEIGAFIQLKWMGQLRQNRSKKPEIRFSTPGWCSQCSATRAVTKPLAILPHNIQQTSQHGILLMERTLWTHNMACEVCYWLYHFDANNHSKRKWSILNFLVDQNYWNYSNSMYAQKIITLRPYVRLDSS